MCATQYIPVMMSFPVIPTEIYGRSGELATSMLGYFCMDCHCQALHHSQATAGGGCSGLISDLQQGLTAYRTTAFTSS